MTQSCAQNSFALKPIEADYDTTRGDRATTTPSTTRTANGVGSLRVVSRNEASVGNAPPAEAALTHCARGLRVAGATPVVRCLRSGAAGVGIRQIVVILNGSSNSVLERVADGTSLADAMATAQRLGYAAADPTRDLTSEDAEDKLRVLAWLAFVGDPPLIAPTSRTNRL